MDVFEGSMMTCVVGREVGEAKELRVGEMNR